LNANGFAVFVQAVEFLCRRDKNEGSCAKPLAGWLVGWFWLVGWLAGCGFAQIDVQNKGLCAAGTFAQKPMPKRWFAV